MKTPRWMKPPRSDDTEERVVRIAIESIHPDPDNPRRHVDPDALRELSTQLRTTGRLLHPIRVRADGSGGFVVITGQRRLAAARDAGWETISAIVDGECGPGQVLEDQLVENLAREDMRPLDVGHAIHALLEQGGLSRVQVAARLGRSQAWITRHLKLLAIEGPTREALEQGLVHCADAAATLAELPEPVQSEVVAEARERGAAVTRSAARRALEESKRPAPRRSAAEGANCAGEPEARASTSVRLSLRTQDLRWILGALGAEAPEQDDALVPALRALLEAIRDHDSAGAEETGEAPDVRGEGEDTGASP